MDSLWLCEPCGLTQSPLAIVCPVCETPRPDALEAALERDDPTGVATHSRWRCVACETVSAEDAFSCPACGAPASSGSSVLDASAVVSPTTVVSRASSPPPVRPATPSTPVLASTNPSVNARYARNFGIGALVVSFIPVLGMLGALACGGAAIVHAVRSLAEAKNPSNDRTTSMVAILMASVAIVLGFIITISA